MEYRHLDQVLELIIDHRGKTAPKLGGQWVDEGIPVISANNLNDGQFVEMHSVKHIRRGLFDKWMPVELQEGDVLLVSEGATFGQLLYLRKKIQAAIGQRLFALRCNDDYVGRYLYYYLKSRDGQNELSFRTTGTSVLGIRQSELRKIRVPDVVKEAQRKISDLLGSIDDKILLNSEMNDALERLGQLIFKHWFIDFEFPSEEGRPYKSCVGDMVYDEELGKEIPKGWKVVKISEICSTQYGYTASASEDPVGPRFLRVTDMNKKPWIDWSEVPHCQIDENSLKRYGLSIGDILVSRMADPGKAAIVEDNIEAVFASYLIRLRTESLGWSYYLFYFLRSQMYLNYVESAKGGSVQSNMNAKVMTFADILLPSQDVIDRFLSAVKPLRDRITVNLRESDALAAIRNLLLPKLMSGKLEVPVEVR
jgi:type I restriction enzyme S subunit